MKWKGRRTSSNVEDARGRRVVAGGAGAGALLQLVGRSFGWKGILVVIVVAVLGWKMGLLDPSGPVQLGSCAIGVRPLMLMQLGSDHYK